MISHEHRCIFIHIPKCAGTSVENALGHYDKHTGNRGGQDHRSVRMIEQPWLTSSSLTSTDNIRELVRRYRYPRSEILNENNRLTVSRAQYRDYYKFTIVRNPWARAFSWYRNVISDSQHLERRGLTADVTFSDFLHQFAGHGMLQTQMYWLKDFDGKIPMDFIGRFENLAEDFRTVCNNLGLSDIELPHKVKGNSAGYREHYDAKTKDLMASVYREEIKAFGYDFDQS